MINDTEKSRRIVELERFIASFLSPEERGLAVPAHVRDDAREILGMDRVETKKQRKNKGKAGA